MAQARSTIKKGAKVSHRLQGLYAITDEYLTPDETVLDQAKSALQSGVKLLQYRNKHDSDEKVESICIELQALCREYGALFIIDDRPYLAQKIQADGLHVGKNDMPLSQARAIFKDGIIGVSCYGSVKKALQAEDDGASYVAFGSFFYSPTKPLSGIVSPSVLKKAKEQLSIPICAIGGIDTTNIHNVAALKPDMICCVSAIFDGDIKNNVKILKQGMNV